MLNHYPKIPSAPMKLEKWETITLNYAFILQLEMLSVCFNGSLIARNRYLIILIVSTLYVGCASGIAALLPPELPTEHYSV